MRRTAEAVTLRIRVNRLLGSGDNVPLLLLGDLNDVPEAQTSLILTGPPGNQIGTLGFDRPDKGDAARLFNLAVLIDDERRYSRIETGRKELLDQILASAKLFPVGENDRRRLPEVDSHVDFRDTSAVRDVPYLALASGVGPERVDDEDAVVGLAGVQTLGVEAAATQRAGTGEDHGVPEGDGGSLIELGGQEHVGGARGVDVPGREVLDDGRDLTRRQRPWDLAGEVDEDLLKHLYAGAALA